MKNYIFFFFIFTSSMLFGQISFRHISTASNTSGHITTLNHSQLNGNPNALIFIMPNWNTNGGSNTSGVSYNENAGVWYNGAQWTIFNENTSATMPLNVTFNVLIAPSGNPNYFTVSKTEANSDNFANGFKIDNPASNNKTDAFILVTQNLDKVYNDNAPIVSYANGKWNIGNNRYMQYYYDNAKSHVLMKTGARFNIMVIENGVVPGFSNASAFKHIVSEQNTIPAGSHISFLDQAGVNGNQDAILFATPYWGHGDADRADDPTKAGGPYDESSSMMWYDHPNDSWKHKDNFWSIIHKGVDAMPKGAKFFVAAVGVDAKQPTPLVATSPLNLELDKLTYKNGESIKSRLTLNSKINIGQNKFVFYVSSKTKDVESVEIESTDGTVFTTKKDVIIQTAGSTNPNDGKLSVEAGEVITVFYYLNQTQKSSNPKYPDYISDFALISGTVKESPIEVNSKIALSDNEKNTKGEIVSGTLMVATEVPIEIATSQVIYNGKPQDIKRFLDYSKGRLLGSLPTLDSLSGQMMYLVEVKLDNIDLANLPQIRSLWGPKDKLIGSNSEVLKLVQFCIQAQMDGFTISPNPKFISSEGGTSNNCNCLAEDNNPTFLTGESYPDSYNLRLGGTPWIPSVWNYLAIWDRDNERINVGIIDQGFDYNLDYGVPAREISQCQITIDNGVRLNCSENAAMGPPTVDDSGVYGRSWHGNAVWSRIGGVLNNGPLNTTINSTAGVAGQVARPILIKLGGMDAYAFGIAVGIRQAVDRGAQVINISGGYPCRVLTNILGWAPNICSEGGRLEICAALAPIVQGTALIGCGAAGLFCPPCGIVCAVGVTSGYIAGCIAQVALGNPPNAMNDAIQYAKSRGVPVIASAGNIINRDALVNRVPSVLLDLIDLSPNRMTVEDWQAVPAVLPDVICVGAANVASPYQNTQVFGNRIDIWGPEDGNFIAPSTTGAAPNGGYQQRLHPRFGGTSSAAPFITGLVANAMAVNPQLNPLNPSLSTEQKSQIPTTIRNLLISSAYQQSSLPTDPTNRRRNLVNPLGFINAVNNQYNGIIPNLTRYGSNYNLDEPDNDIYANQTRITPSLFSDVIITDAIVFIPSKGNGSVEILDKDHYTVVIPNETGQFTFDILLTTPRGDRYGNLFINTFDGRIQLISSTLINNDEEVKTYRVTDATYNRNLTFWVQGRDTDDNLYELTIKRLTRQGNTEVNVCNNATTNLQEGIYTIRLNANNKALDAPDNNNVHLWDYHGGNNQLWYIKPYLENGKYLHTIVNLANGNSLSDQSIDGCDGAGNGSRVGLRPLNVVDQRTKWQIENAGNGTLLIRSICPEYQIIQGRIENYQQNGGEVIYQQCATGTTNKWGIQRVRDITFQTIQAQAVTGLCPFNKVAGDYEFGGNGPALLGNVLISISADGNSLEATINFTARETAGDRSEVRGSWTRTIYTAPAGMRILNINSPTYCSINQVLQGGGRNEVFEGCDGGEHTITPGGAIAQIKLIGDTGGNDISADADCNCDTRINRIDFNPIEIVFVVR